jgi:sugar phosphate isomerase/epimerase
MQLGVMTNPRMDLIPQIRWIGENSFDFVDLAVEPPMADVSELNRKELAGILSSQKLGVIIHTSPFLPLASMHRGAREAAYAELLQDMELAHQCNSRLMTLHYVGKPDPFTYEEGLDLYTRLLSSLCQAAKGTSLSIAIENSPLKNPEEFRFFQDVFRLVPDIHLLLDVGHAHILASKSDLGSVKDFLQDPTLGARLSHIHISDNDGTFDGHLPLGSVRRGIDWPDVARLLRNHRYDDTITLEVFSPDRDFLLLSRQKFLRWWRQEE